MSQDFLGGAVERNPPANAGDRCSISGLGRPHRPRAISRCTTTTEPALEGPRAATARLVCLQPVLRNKRSHCSEEPAHHNEEEPHSLQLEKAHTSNEDPSTGKNKYINNFF